MKDYVPVNERIEAFYTAFPNGSLQTEIVELTENRVSVKAYAYRTPDDPRPGTGHSSLNIPGSTPYTKGSEIENAETSAWGRAIAALGFEVKRGLSSAEEVRNKQQGASPSRAAASSQGATDPVPAPYRRAELAELMREKEIDLAGVEQYATLVGIPADERPMSNDSMDALINALRGHGTAEPLELPLGGAETPQEPPKPGTDEYKALSVTDRAYARAHWAAQEVPA
jgi:hypothetical protein